MHNFFAHGRRRDDGVGYFLFVEGQRYLTDQFLTMHHRASGYVPFLYSVPHHHGFSAAGGAVYEHNPGAPCVRFVGPAV
jgi:hypothetical protein